MRGISRITPEELKEAEDKARRGLDRYLSMIQGTTSDKPDVMVVSIGSGNNDEQSYPDFLKNMPKDKRFVHYNIDPSILEEKSHDTNTYGNLRYHTHFLRDAFDPKISGQALTDSSEWIKPLQDHLDSGKKLILCDYFHASDTFFKFCKKNLDKYGDSLFCVYGHEKGEPCFLPDRNYFEEASNYSEFGKYLFPGSDSAIPATGKFDKGVRVLQPDITIDHFKINNRLAYEEKESHRESGLHKSMETHSDKEKKLCNMLIAAIRNVEYWQSEGIALQVTQGQGQNQGNQGGNNNLIQKFNNYFTEFCNLHHLSGLDWTGDTVLRDEFINGLKNIALNESQSQGQSQHRLFDHATPSSHLFEFSRLISSISQGTGNTEDHINAAMETDAVRRSVSSDYIRPGV